MYVFVVCTRQLPHPHLCEHVEDLFLREVVQGLETQVVQERSHLLG